MVTDRRVRHTISRLGKLGVSVSPEHAKRELARITRRNKQKEQDHE
jgi:hypothetical protein